MNYRLGTLGFLSGIDDEHRGNFGVRQGSTDLAGQFLHRKVRRSLVPGTSKWLSNGFIEILNTLVGTRIESQSLDARRAGAQWVPK